jgi:putative YphP/YqiW family bacilliredoxin
MYDENLVAPMRAELTSAGFKELKSAAEVDAEIKTGAALVVVNSVCGCAAGGARPGARLAVQSGLKVDKLLTVFAGQDREATERARSYFLGFPPSSPSIAFLRDGKIVGMLERRDIEGYSPMEIAEKIRALVGEG